MYLFLSSIVRRAKQRSPIYKALSLPFISSFFSATQAKLNKPPSNFENPRTDSPTQPSWNKIRNLFSTRSIPIFPGKKEQNKITQSKLEPISKPTTENETNRPEMMREGCAVARCAQKDGASEWKALIGRVDWESLKRDGLGSWNKTMRSI